VRVDSARSVSASSRFSPAGGPRDSGDGAGRLDGGSAAAVFRLAQNSPEPLRPEALEMPEGVRGPEGVPGPWDIGYEGEAPLAPESPPGSPPLRTLRKTPSRADGSPNGGSRSGESSVSRGDEQAARLSAPSVLRERRASSENDKGALPEECDALLARPPAAITSHRSNPLLGSPALTGTTAAAAAAAAAAASAASAAAAVAAAMAAAHKFDMVLAVSDDRTHEDLPSAWREGPSAALPALAQLAHGVFAVSSAGPAARTRAKYFVEDTSEVKLQEGRVPEACAPSSN
jgi:hypothetical protein